MPTYRRPIVLATAQVVPVPTNGSSTISPGKWTNGTIGVEAHQARRQLFRKWGRMVAFALYVLRVHEPDLLGEVEPFRPGKLIGVLDVGSNFGGLPGFT